MPPRGMLTGQPCLAPLQQSAQAFGLQRPVAYRARRRSSGPMAAVWNVYVLPPGCALRCAWEVATQKTARLSCGESIPPAELSLIAAARGRPWHDVFGFVRRATASCGAPRGRGRSGGRGRGAFMRRSSRRICAGDSDEEEEAQDDSAQVLLRRAFWRARARPISSSTVATDIWTMRSGATPDADLHRCRRALLCASRSSV